MNLLKRWAVFISERFEPVSHTFMIASFFGANAIMAFIVNNSPGSCGLQQPGCCNLKIMGGFFLVWLVFFHMRLFDDIKDYETDRLVNKDRPLPRGVLTAIEFGAGILFTEILEVILAASLGIKVFSTYTIVLAFTLIMRQEFFIGDWLRPKMELYAITHTFSATLMGFLIFSALTDNFINDTPWQYSAIAAGNWFVFNVFEFGRKTFAKDEEREGVDSYSLRLSPGGAVILLGVNIFMAFLMLYLCCVSLTPVNLQQAGVNNFGVMLISAAVISFIVAISGVFYSLNPSRFYAKFYRGVVSAYLVLYHAAILVSGYLIIK